MPVLTVLLLLHLWWQEDLLLKFASVSSGSAPTAHSQFRKACAICNDRSGKLGPVCQRSRVTLDGTEVSAARHSGPVYHVERVTESDIAIHKRFYTAIVLWHASFVGPIEKTADVFHVDVAAITALRKSAYTFTGTGCLASVAHALGAWLRWRWWLPVQARWTSSPSTFRTRT